jgi:hypothetical protein
MQILIWNILLIYPKGEEPLTTSSGVVRHEPGTRRMASVPREQCCLKGHSVHASRSNCSDFSLVFRAGHGSWVYCLWRLLMPPGLALFGLHDSYWKQEWWSFPPSLQPAESKVLGLAHWCLSRCLGERHVSESSCLWSDGRLTGCTWSTYSKIPTFQTLGLPPLHCVRKAMDLSLFGYTSLQIQFH